MILCDLPFTGDVVSALRAGRGHVDSSIEVCAGFRRGNAPHIFFCLDKRKRAAPGTKENRRFVKTPFENGRLSWARSHPAAPDLWRFQDAHAAVVTLHQTSFGTWGTGFRFPSPPASLRFRGHLEKAAASKCFTQRPATAHVSRQAVGMRKPVPRVPASPAPSDANAAQASFKFQRDSAAGSSQAGQHPTY